MSTDVVGNKIDIGDQVAFVEPRHMNLLIGSVVKVTPKGATVMAIIDKKPTKLNRRSTQLCLIEDASDCIVPALGWEDYGE